MGSIFQNPKRIVWRKVTREQGKSIIMTHSRQFKSILTQPYWMKKNGRCKKMEQQRKLNKLKTLWCQVRQYLIYPEWACKNSMNDKTKLVRRSMLPATLVTLATYPCLLQPLQSRQTKCPMLCRPFQNQWPKRIWSHCKTLEANSDWLRRPELQRTKIQSWTKYLSKLQTLMQRTMLRRCSI